MKNKALFIDRDGVINNDVGHYYIYKENDFVLNNGIIEGLLKIQKHNYLIIVITNQGGIAKKKYSNIDVELVHNKMIREFSNNGIIITDIFYCPHHSDLEKCLCRKPDSLLIEKAIARYNIDVKKSFLIGDKESDINAGKKVGIQSYIVKKNTSILPIIKQILNEQE